MAHRSVRPSVSPVTLLAVGAIVVMVFSGCAQASPEVESGDPILLQGRDVYSRNCASCHGSAGQGGRGDRLNGGAVLDAYPDPQVQIDLVADGRNSMPSFRGRLSDADLGAVVRYTREVLNDEVP